MTTQIVMPFIHVEDANGLPHVGAKLYVYLPGTTTLASLYSDDALIVPMTNPLEGINASDAAGNFPRAYIAAGTYKLRAVTSADVLIWQYDNIDTGLPASTGALPISRGGTGATTAAAARVNLDVPSNSELADLADDITALQSSLQNVVSTPQGYLTMTSGSTFLTSDVVAGGAVYYTPDTGNLSPIWNGTQHVIYQFSELTLTLNSNHVANAIYDAYLTLDSGAPIIVTGPAWNTPTAGSGSRGSGAGTTELIRRGGLYVNANAMTARNGATTYAVEANKATYLGSLFMDGTNAQLTCHVTPGASRKFGVFNAYNRKPLCLTVRDATASWTVSAAAYPACQRSNVSTANQLALFMGLRDQTVGIQFSQISTSATAGVQSIIGIGINSATTISGKIGESTTATRTTLEASYDYIPTLGLSNINALESQLTGNATMFGAERMDFSARWVG